MASTKRTGRVAAPAGRVTARDVAELAGVHPATVSRAVNPATSAMIRPDTVARVLTAARRLGYSPDPAARSLRTQRSATIGVLVPDLTNPMFPPIVRGIEDVLMSHGYTPLIANTDDDSEREARVVEALLDRRIDGLVVASARRIDPLPAVARARGCPVVLVNRTTDETVCPQVTGDDESGIRDAVRHLVGLGHARIAHLAGPAWVSTGYHRRQAFRRATDECGLARRATPVFECARYQEDAGEAAMRRLLRSHPTVTAVVAANDLIALGALRALRRSGLSCPAQLSMTGFNDIPFVAELTPGLTTVRVPQQELGAQAARLLLDVLAGSTAAPTVILPVELIVRGSTAPPRLA